MTLEAAKEMDRRCVLNWLNEVYVTPSRAFNEYTDDELKMFAHDAIVLLKEETKIVRCKDCKHFEPDGIYTMCYLHNGLSQNADWYCADGERR